MLCVVSLSLCNFVSINSERSADTDTIKAQYDLIGVKIAIKLQPSNLHESDFFHPVLSHFWLGGRKAIQPIKTYLPQWFSLQWVGEEN